MDHFIVGDIDSVQIEGTFNVLNLYRRGKGMVFQMWEYERPPLNLQ